MTTNLIPDHLTDASLEVEVLTAYAPRRAELLLTVPAEHRAILVQEAHYIGNCTGGRPSDNLALAIRHGIHHLTSPTAKAMAQDLT